MKRLLAVLLIVVLVLWMYDVHVQSTGYWEDGSGTVTLSYCEPFSLCRR